MNIRKFLMIAVSLLTASLQGMPAPKIPIGRQNQLQSDTNQQKFQQNPAPFFTLAVLQPTKGYKSLEAHVDAEKGAIKAVGYDDFVDEDDLHLSVIVLAIPFPNGKISPQYVQQAIDALEAILTKYLQELTDVTFEYKDLESIGPKFIAAIFERTGPKPFFRVYGKILREFFDQYPNSWSFYGYEMKPHVSIAKTPKGAAPVVGSITIPGAPAKPIRDLNLRHAGRGFQRKLQINARWQDAKNKWFELQSNSL